MSGCWSGGSGDRSVGFNWLQEPLVVSQKLHVVCGERCQRANVPAIVPDPVPLFLVQDQGHGSLEVHERVPHGLVHLADLP